MANTYKVLGQSAPAATTNTDIYTVPASTEAVVSTIIMANRSTGSTTYRIAIRPSGATLSNEHYVAFDVSIGALDSTALTLGVTLQATDVITVFAGSADISFSIFGSEIV